MRFYDPSDPTPSPVSAEAIFPKADTEEACRRCIAMGMVPSVTSVLGVIRQEYVERWKMSEAIKNFQKHGNAWLAVDSMFNSDSRESRFGTEVHDCVHRWLTGQEIVKGRPWDHALPAVDWLRRNMGKLLVSEGTYACRETGTGGTIDIAFESKDGRPVLADIKVVKMRKAYPPKPPLAYRAQLSAYEMMLRARGMPPMQRVSLYLASPFGDMTVPKVTVFLYNRDYEKEFRAALEIWHAQFGGGVEKLAPSD